MSIFYCRPPNLGDYTDPTRKRMQGVPRQAVATGRLVLDPLKEPEKSKYGVLQRWIIGKGVKGPQESSIGQFDTQWWLNLKTPSAWLEDTVTFRQSFIVIYIYLSLSYAISNCCIFFSSILRLLKKCYVGDAKHSGRCTDRMR